MILIDADIENGKLLDFITQNDTAIGYAIEHKDMTMLEGIFAEYFDEQKTAYDSEKVVKQLEELKEKGYAELMMCEVNELIDQAVEIVKRGGINE